MSVNLNNIRVLYKGTVDYSDMARLKALPPCSDKVVGFLNDLSSDILNDNAYREHSDVVALGFFIRKANLQNMKESLLDSYTRLGRGLAFHIAPANVPINFAYSLIAGLLSGNANIVKVSSRDFPQVKLLCSTIGKVLSKPEHGSLADYIAVVQYQNDREINDYFSLLCQSRLIWGGDETIAEIRKSPISSRSVDITFANRYSLCIINAEVYNKSEDKEEVTKGFYSDTYGFDQNACFSPRLIYWVGNDEQIREAKTEFWHRLHNYAQSLYCIEDNIVSEKYMSACRTVLFNENIHIEKMPDNLIYRGTVVELNEDLLNGTCAGGFFLEYASKNLDGLMHICSKKIQTLSCFGYEPKQLVCYIVNEGLHGVDRVTQVGKSHEFSLMWDGVNLLTALSRVINC